MTIAFVASALAFLITGVLPGDPAVAILGESATAEQAQALRVELGLDRPAPERYAHWLWNAIHGDLGRSYRSNETVARMVRDRFPVTLELIVLSQAIALALALPAGILAAYRRGSWFDRTATASSVALLSTPSFLIGISLIYLLSVRLGALPAAGFKSIGEGITENLQSMLLPSLTLALAEVPVYFRILRSDLIATLQQDFVLVARAKGLTPRQVLLGHALKPSSFSLITVVGINMGRLVGGAVIIETLFALPGIGQMLATAAFQQDNFAIQGVVLLVVAAFVLVNLLVDGIYGLLDPRVHHALRD
jgi:peptide/nickel transport system permease protein